MSSDYLTTQRRQSRARPIPILTCECAREVPLRFMYKCFFCKAWFCGACAEVHFGARIACEPACTIDVRKYRLIESELDRYREEDTDLHREIHRLHHSHHVALQRAEEEGYAKGLRDGADVSP